MKFKRMLFRLQRYFVVHWLLFRDKRTPMISKILLVLSVVYLIIPIDIIPDVIPVAGFLDELIIIPLIFFAATFFIPKHVLDEYKTTAKHARHNPDEVQEGEIIE